MCKRLHTYKKVSAEKPVEICGNTGFYQDITEAEKWGGLKEKHPATPCPSEGVCTPGGAVRQAPLQRVKVAALAGVPNTPITRNTQKAARWKTAPQAGAAGQVKGPLAGGRPPGGAGQGDGRGDGGFGKRLGLFLSTARGGCGLTQRHVGRVLGVSFQQVQKFEYGHNRLSVWQLLTLCRLYGVPMYFIDLLGCDAEPRALARQALALRCWQQAPAIQEV